MLAGGLTPDNVAEQAMALYREGRVRKILLTGGSGFYIRALIDGLQAAAEVLGIDPSTLYRKLNRYGIES